MNCPTYVKPDPTQPDSGSLTSQLSAEAAPGSSWVWARSASCWLVCDVRPGWSGNSSPNLLVSADATDGTLIASSRVIADAKRRMRDSFLSGGNGRRPGHSLLKRSGRFAYATVHACPAPPAAGEAISASDRSRP